MPANNTEIEKRLWEAARMFGQQTLRVLETLRVWCSE